MKTTLYKYLVKIDREEEGINIFKNEKGEDIIIQTEILPQNAGYYATQKGTVMNTPQAKWRRKVEHNEEKGWFFPDSNEECFECIILFDEEIGYNYVEMPIVRTAFRNDVEIKAGDVIYFHHHVSDDNNRVEDLYICEHRHIFGRLRDGIFTPVEDWVFCEPIPYEGEERSSGLLVPHLISGMTQKGFEGQIIGKWHPSEAIVRYVPRFWQNQLKKGDRISFIRNADYDMKVEGEVLFRINAEHIMYTV